MSITLQHKSKYNSEEKKEAIALLSEELEGNNHIFYIIRHRPSYQTQYVSFYIIKNNLPTPITYDVSCIVGLTAYSVDGKDTVCLRHQTRAEDIVKILSKKLNMMLSENVGKLKAQEI